MKGRALQEVGNTPLAILWLKTAREGRPRDPEVLRVAARVGYELDDTIDYPRQFVGDVAITLAGGDVVRERQDRPRGGPDAPLTRGELEAKFRDCAKIVLDAKAVETVLNRCLALETVPDVSEVLNVIAAGVKPPAVATRSRAYA